MSLLWIIIVVLFILWLLGFFGRRVSSSFPQTGGWIHILIVIAVILVILRSSWNGVIPLAMIGGLFSRGF